VKVAQYIVTIAGQDYEGSYAKVKELRAQAIRLNVGCSGIRAKVGSG
jgi:hypothetical protein